MGITDDKVIKEAAERYVQRAAFGQKAIRERWSRLLPSTRQAFVTLGYDEKRGMRQQSGDDSADVESVEYAVGALKEAADAKVPSKRTDEIPAVLNSDDVLHEAANLFHKPEWRDPELVRLAIIAIVNQQTTGALSSLYFTGGSPDTPPSSTFKAVARIIGLIVFGIGLPIAIGVGLASASKGDGFVASLCAFFAFFAVHFFREEKEKPPTAEMTSYTGWFAIRYRNTHIGSGHGLHVALEAMVRKGTFVPNVLFDLCAILQSSLAPKSRLLDPAQS